MITTTQYRELDRFITAHLKNLGNLHIADVRGQHSNELVEATVISWRNILVNLLELSDQHKNYCLTYDQYAIVLPMVQDVTTSAGIVETLRERKVLGIEEGVGKNLIEVIDKKLDVAIQNRNTAYEKFSSYMVSLLDYSAEE